MTEEEWYELEVMTEDQLRNILSQRGDKTMRALQMLSLSNVDFISNFSTYIGVDQPIKCNDLFEGRLKYRLDTIVGRGKAGEVTLLKSDNVNLIIKSMPASISNYLSIRLLDYDVSISNPWIEYWRITDINNKRIIVTVGGDNFATQTCLHLILNIILGNNPNYVRLYDSFYCNSVGYNVIEHADSGDLHGFLNNSNVTDNLLFDIIPQILTPLSILKHPMYYFNHSDLKAKNVFVDRMGNDYIFKIADYDKSSITWNGFRFYNWSGHYTNPPIVNLEKDKQGLDVYMLSSSLVPLQVYTMYNPYGIPMSYDIYTFILSLFGIDAVWNKYISGYLPKFKDLMHRLFVNELYYIIMGRIADDPKTLSSLTKINSVLNGIYLQYDLSYVYNEFGVTPPPLTTSDFDTMKIVISKDRPICTDECKINSSLNSRYKTCTTNKYSKTQFTGTSRTYEWDYC